MNGEEKWLQNRKIPRLIQSVKRAMDIINCFDPYHTQLSLSEISKKLNLNMSTVHGIINTLCAYSYIDKNPENGKYRLGLEFLVKANLVSASLDLKEIGYSFLMDLTKKHHETTHLYMCQHDQLFCIAKVDVPNNYSIISSKTGGKLPLHASASGKVFLAYKDPAELERILNEYEFERFTEHTIADKAQLMEHLQEIRSKGYSTEDEEIEHGAYSIAAPVKDAAHAVVGTISIVGSKVRMMKNKERMIEDIVEAAHAISSRFGYKPHPHYASTGTANSSNV